MEEATNPWVQATKKRRPRGLTRGTWGAFLTLILPNYHQPSAKGGRLPFPVEVMLRIQLQQQ
jgi:hypothetical protein